ncbi:MAG: IS3 family transposase, partial [Flavobacteriales bacterium]|nr:IS3 family transposase [Flavobacteriales bacterium]
AESFFKTLKTECVYRQTDLSKKRSRNVNFRLVGNVV